MTIDGKLDWQNQLNMQNKPFFDLCDGIFVNYTWKVAFYFLLCNKNYIFFLFIPCFYMSLNPTG